jgi:hypothetical protein
MAAGDMLRYLNLLKKWLLFIKYTFCLVKVYNRFMMSTLEWSCLTAEEGGQLVENLTNGGLK